MATYRIGTRGSLLAVTQSTLIKNELEKISGKSFELVLIKTQGDQITDRPLWQLEGKDFFTKELDEALLKGEVDLVIHSYKDLGSERPAGIKLAAVTERRFAHDILLIPQDKVDQLKDWSGEFVVGTSSPRRIVNLTHRLKDFLPHGDKLTVRCETLRGNVNSRIRKLKEGQYHAITLALAGIERLAHTDESRQELTGLLQGLNYLVLPQSVFPSAASQGALGLEIRDNREDGGRLHSLVSKMAHENTIEEVLRERKAFKDFGGGCHLAVGIHVKKVGETFLHVHSGEVEGKRVEKRWLEGQELPDIGKRRKLFVGLPQGDKPDVVYDQLLKKVPHQKKLQLSHKHVFVTSRHCLDTLTLSLPSAPQGIWAAGTKTAEELTKKGLWINGSSDSLGTADLLALKSSKALQIIHPSISEDWTVLSHDQATSDLGQVEGCYYREELNADSTYAETLGTVGAFYWTSYPQYQAFISKYPFIAEAYHFCGLGKTWQEFDCAQIKVWPLASMQNFFDLAK